MKLAFLCSSFSWGGLEMNNLKLCAWLQERGQEPILICPAKSRLALEASHENIPTINFDHRNKHLVLSSSFHLSKILAEEKINILIIGHYRHLYVSVWTKLFAKRSIRLIYWQQMQVALNRKDFYHAFFYKNLDAWITPLGVLKRQLLNNTVLQETRIHVIPLGIELSRFLGVSHQKREARNTFEISPDEFLVGIIGRIDKQKGQETLLHAIKNLKARGVPVKGIVIGEESYGHEGYLAFLQKLSNELQIEKEIYFRPFVKQVATAFACLDIFVMASQSEPIGMVTVEAMAAGIPVIGTNSGGTPELLNNGESGLLFEPMHAEQLAEHILTLYQNPALRLAYAQKGTQRAIFYSHDAQCQLFEGLIESLNSRP